MLVLGCGPGPASDSDAVVDTAGEVGCQESSCTDAAACGPENLNCLGALNIGSCVDGACGPRLSPCNSAASTSSTCTEVCESDGGTCAAGGCSGKTAFAFPDPNACSVSAFPVALDYECATPLDYSDPARALIRCCCE